MEAALKLKEMAIVHAEAAETWEMASGAATIVGPGAVVVALAPDGPGRAATAEFVAPRGRMGRAGHRGRADGVRARVDPPAPARRRHRGPRPADGRATGRDAGVRPGPSCVASTPIIPAGSSATTARVSATSSASEEARRCGSCSSAPARVEFTRNLLGDILSYPELADAEIVLHDIDADRLRTAERMAAYVADALGAKPGVEAHLDRRAALPGADVVIDTIQVGGAAATKVDFDIPARYGLRYTINDTINVGGVMRGLRTVPVVLGIVGTWRSCAPTLVPQLHEPDGHPGPGGRRAQ